jgi:tripartite-type tricarboxylate transporter receptor subunit TctC
MSTAFNRLASIGLALLAVAPAALADNYPSRPVRIVVPNAAGGPTDFLGRSIGQKLSARIGQPVVIENRPGAASIVGAETVARAKADGYTLLLATMGALALNPAIYSKLPYDPAKDFAPVGLISVTSNVLSIRSSLPISSVADLVAYAKREPDKLTFASVGVGSSSHLAGELFKSIAGVHMRHVPYKAGASIRFDIQEGHVDMSFGPEGSTFRDFKEGGDKRRVLMVTGKTRSALFPDVPTAEEAGLKGYEQTIWFGLNAPAGTPSTVIERLNKELNAILETPQMQKELAADGQSAHPMTPQQYEAFVAQERQKWAPVVRAAGARID